MSKSNLDKILQPEFFNQEAIYLMHSTDHACSMRFYNGNWYFYDPEFSEGEKCFTNLSDLQKELHSSLGDIMSIEIASWNPDVDLSNFVATRQAMLENNELGLSDGPASSEVFFEMLRSAPDQFSELISLSERQEKSRIYLANLLSVMHYGRQTNNLQNIIKFAPDEFFRIVTLATKHSDLYQSMVTGLENRSIFQWTSINLITQYSPRALEPLIVLAEKDEAIRKMVSISLGNKIKTGETGIQLIAKFAPEQLGKIIALSKTDEHIQFALISALKEKNAENLEVLNKISQFFPSEKEWVEMQIRDLCALEILKRNIRISIDRFARKSPWCVDYSNPAMFKSPSEGGKIVSALMEKISESKSVSAVQRHLENSKVTTGGDPEFNQCLDNCIQVIVKQSQASIPKIS